MHAHALRSLGLPGTYEALETPLVHLADRLEEVRREYRGVNLTIPLKEKALELVDWAAPEAKAIGGGQHGAFPGGAPLRLQYRRFGLSGGPEGGGVFPFRGPALVLGAGGRAGGAGGGLRP
jgi:shikimate dehydrogenase